LKSVQGWYLQRLQKKYIHMLQLILQERKNPRFMVIITNILIKYCTYKYLLMTSSEYYELFLLWYIKKILI
jgi:hypothetical protein